MALTLRVAADRWRAHLVETVRGFPGVVPVVKGNGYGFGRARLASVATSLGADEIAVGTVHELADVSGGGTRLVLTPALAGELASSPADAVVTVGSLRHLEELVRSGTASGRPVVVKVRSAMGRYGVAARDVGDLIGQVERAGAVVHGVAIHPPLAGSAADHAAEVTALIARSRVPADLAVYVSHLDAAQYAALRDAHPSHPFRIRLGTALWHGDKSSLQLVVDVIDVRPARAGERAGYRLTPVPADGHLVLVTAGTAHGVHPLRGDVSPFHFDRRRLPLLEPPHMHTSMALALDDGAVPGVGDVVDVQRPLTQTLVDRIVEHAAG